VPRLLSEVIRGLRGGTTGS